MIMIYKPFFAKEDKTFHLYKFYNFHPPLLTLFHISALFESFFKRLDE